MSKSKDLSVVENALLDVDADDVSALVQFTPAEDALVFAVVHSEKPLEELIPETTSVADVWMGINAIAKGWRGNQLAANRLKLALGRYLFVLKKNPEIFKSYGYRNWNDFVTNYVPRKMHISRPEAFNILTVAEMLPELAGEQIDDIAQISKVILVAKHVKEFPEKKRAEVAAEWTEKAKVLTMNQMKAEMETARMREKGDLSRVACLISLLPATKKMWEEMVADGRVHSFVGSSDPDIIFAAMLAECFTEWIAKTEDAGRSVPMAEYSGEWRPEDELPVYEQ